MVVVVVVVKLLLDLLLAVPFVLGFVFIEAFLGVAFFVRLLNLL